MRKPGSNNNYNYMQRYMMAYSTRLEDALERIMKTDDILQARMIAAVALGREPEGETLVQLMSGVSAGVGVVDEAFGELSRAVDDAQELAF